jgi:hypothetical protein
MNCVAIANFMNATAGGTYIYQLDLNDQLILKRFIRSSEAKE